MHFVHLLSQLLQSKFGSIESCTDFIDFGLSTLRL